MPTVVKKGNAVLVSGRAGELTQFADEKTFALLAEIFGSTGPYRKVLKQFGIGATKNTDNFLVLLDGKVFSDVTKENKALWESCMYKLRVDGNKVELKINLTPTGVLKGFPGFIKKNYVDTKVLANLQKTLTAADEKYRNYCELVAETLKTKNISKSNFLAAYEYVVYITYIFELLFNFNDGAKKAKKIDSGSVAENTVENQLREYVRQNDYLLKYDDSYIEFAFNPKNGFAVNNLENSNALEAALLNNQKLIPDVIETPQIKCDPKLLAEKKLQCLKNNMRLKTNILLYYLKT